MFFELFPLFMLIVSAIVGMSLFLRRNTPNDPNDPNDLSA